MKVITFLAIALVASSVAAAAHSIPIPLPYSTLREAAAVLNLHLGSAIAVSHLENASDKSYTTVYEREFDLSTAENECKFTATEPAQGEFSFAACDVVYNYSYRMRGHNLCWGASNPQWLLGGNFTPPELIAILQQHISTVVGHYKDKPRLISWDVVNEAVCDGNSPKVPILCRSPPWYPAVPNYIDIAFQTARQADPSKLLFYNDYGGEGMSNKSNRIYELVKGMRQRGIPIDGVGLESHFTLDSVPSRQSLLANMQRLGALGLIVHITELDIKCTPAPCNETGLIQQAKAYDDVLRACLESNGTCQSFEVWEFTDKYTWLNFFQNPNHIDYKPLPFDKNYQKKPAYDRLLSTLNEAIKNRTSLIVLDVPRNNSVVVQWKKGCKAMRFFAQSERIELSQKIKLQFCETATRDECGFSDFDSSLGSFAQIPIKFQTPMMSEMRVALNTSAFVAVEIVCPLGSSQ